MNTNLHKFVNFYYLPNDAINNNRNTDILYNTPPPIESHLRGVNFHPPVSCILIIFFAPNTISTTLHTHWKPGSTSSILSAPSFGTLMPQYLTQSTTLATLFHPAFYNATSSQTSNRSEETICRSFSVTRVPSSPNSPPFLPLYSFIPRARYPFRTNRPWQILGTKATGIPRESFWRNAKRQVRSPLPSLAPLTTLSVFFPSSFNIVPSCLYHSCICPSYLSDAFSYKSLIN